MTEKYTELIKEINKKVNSKDRVSFLIELKRFFWGDKRTDLQEDILERYDNEEYWEEDILNSIDYVDSGDYKFKNGKKER